ncbi:histidine acid phosphatase [Penicillium taxi]|uniref:histidine acid phosphatase n=1 Tax=Penicillium taxi TaxID=168475 RepID=UPI0025455CE3|nr:histidine acid phosphatase [Penicillium taxi]KAJ5884741.1 histidine acid phosphatase [Penicillium taxi]
MEPLGPTKGPVDSFYPPLELMSYITNSAYGTFGGIYTAPKDQAQDSGDGSYHYCSMPHPQPDHYQLPFSIRNRSVEAQLVYVEYMQRHQRRTPYNILPVGEDQTYNCDDVRPYLYTAPDSNSSSPIPMYGQTYTDLTNPYAKGYVNGTCQYPQLTIGGFLDGYQHGRDLWAVYGDKLGLLPSSPESQKVWFRSSHSPLTQQSAGAVLRGIWPDHDGTLPLHQQSPEIDTVNRGFPCPARSRLLSKIQSSSEWSRHLTETKTLRDRLATIFSADKSDWMSSFDHFADNFQGRLCNGYRLPCSLKDPSICVTENEAYEVFRAGDWEWNYWWHRNADALKYIQIIEGLFIGEIVRRLEAVSHGTLNRVYTHNFIHDGDIGPILGALGAQQIRWPGMASNIAFEIWKTTKERFFARVLYSGHALRTADGSLEWVDLSVLTDRLKAYVPEDIISMCNS